MPFLRTKNYQTFEVVDETTDRVVHAFEGASKAAKALNGDSPKKVIVVPGRLINIVA